MNAICVRAMKKPQLRAREEKVRGGDTSGDECGDTNLL